MKNLHSVNISVVNMKSQGSPLHVPSLDAACTRIDIEHAREFDTCKIQFLMQKVL